MKTSLVGETGTGKEVAANYYYINSRRFGKILRTVNCSALTETIIESELFGHVKGSFTDADRNKTGFFEECSNGLLFLDEVTNLFDQSSGQNSESDREQGNPSRGR